MGMLIFVSKTCSKFVSEVERTSRTDAICLNVDMPVGVNPFLIFPFPFPLDSVNSEHFSILFLVDS